MSGKPITVIVPKELKDLIPVFMEDCNKEVEMLLAALAAGDMKVLQHVAHRMRGNGGSFGFDKVSALGQQIKESAIAADSERLQAHIAEYAEYLACVKISYD